MTKIAVIIASIGRPRNVANLLDRLGAQTLPPSAIILSSVASSDVPPVEGRAPRPKVVLGPRGLPAQRNTGLDALEDMPDLIAFFDDDYLPSRFCLEHMAALFARHPDLVGANGRLLADGINGSGVSDAEAASLIAAYDADPSPDLSIRKRLTGLYGCNMAYRFAAIGATRFDERLKLYGWQEDIDFAAQLRAKGFLAKTDAFAGVHQGVKGARTSGLRLGYSQVVNPVYLARKGTMDWLFALELMGRNILANHLRLLQPEPWIDRAGRAKGNWIGLKDMLSGRIEPERIESL